MMRKRWMRTLDICILHSLTPQPTQHSFILGGNRVIISQTHFYIHHIVIIDKTPLTMTSDDEHTMLFILLYKPICLHNKTCDKRVFEPGLGLTWTV